MSPAEGSNSTRLAFEARCAVLPNLGTLRQLARLVKPAEVIAASILSNLQIRHR
jgi:hypothetical protein